MSPPLPSRRLAAFLPALLLGLSSGLGAQEIPRVEPITRRDSLAARDPATATRTVQTLDSLIQRAIVFVPPTTSALVHQGLRAQPGSNSGSSGAFGAMFGDLFIGAGYQARTRYTALNDGSVSAGFGLGNAAQYAGLEVAFTSASTFRQGFGANGSMSLKLHRILPRWFGIAVGMENVASWGATDGGSSLYGVVSHHYQFREDATAFLGSLAWNVGAGNNRYLREDDLSIGKTGVNAFASGGIRLHERASVVLDWTGQDLASVVSFVPFRISPLVVTAGFADLTRTAGDGPRFIVGAGAGFRASHLFPRGSGRSDDRNK